VKPGVAGLFCWIAVMPDPLPDIVFLSFGMVETIHRQQLELRGGQDGYIDRGVVESAIAQPRQTFFGDYLHVDIAHMPAAYLFHLVTPQGFLDGNKRTAVMCTLVFADLNGFAIEADEDEFYALTMDVANNRMGKEALADWLCERMVGVE
jgi:death-on-curing protein